MARMDGGAAVCNAKEGLGELDLWNQVREAVSRIDESWADLGTRKDNGGFGFTKKEYATAIYLALRGNKVMSRDDTDGRGDVWVDRKRSEFKAPTSKNAVQQRLKKAHKQGVDAVFLDVRGTDLSRDIDSSAVRGQVESFSNGPIREVWAIGGNEGSSLMSVSQWYAKMYG
jgi:hypothetical protein